MSNVDAEDTQQNKLIRDKGPRPDSHDRGRRLRIVG